MDSLSLLHLEHVWLTILGFKKRHQLPILIRLFGQPPTNPLPLLDGNGFPQFVTFLLTSSNKIYYLVVMITIYFHSLA